MNEPICHEFNDGIRLVYLNKLSEVGHLGFFRAGSRFEKKE